MSQLWLAVTKREFTLIALRVKLRNISVMGRTSWLIQLNQWWYHFFSLRVFSLPHFTLNDVAHGPLFISVCTHMSGWSHLDSWLQILSVCTQFPNLYLPRVLSQTCSHVSNSTPLFFTWIFKRHQGKIHDTIVKVWV